MLLVSVVDVQYYGLGFISGSLKIPWDTLAGRLGEIDPTRVQHAGRRRLPLRLGHGRWR
jgi:hypothetical protein